MACIKAKLILAGAVTHTRLPLDWTYDKTQEQMSCSGKVDILSGR
jgi:hypothetical protein